MAQSNFNPVEATIDDIHAGYKSGQLTCRQVVQAYLDRIDAFDKKGPNLNAMITVNADALSEADRLDAAYKSAGPVGPLHGIPVIVKDQADVKGMPTTLGSLLFKDYYPDRDSFVAEKLRKAGAVFLGKATLGELGGGDTHGSLFGSTRNPYDTERTVGGSSGGSAAAVAANYSTLAIGQEGLASIRRPSTWNCIAGMRPSAGLVSRSGVYGCWPELFGSLGPMARTVKDLALLLDAMAGYDAEDPITARGVGNTPDTFTKFLNANGLKGARFGVLREAIGLNSEPDSEDYRKIQEVFDKSIAELKAGGAEIVDPIVIPKIKELLAKRSGAPGDTDASKHYESLRAQDELMTNFLKVMADHKLDAIVYKSVEHQPTLIKDGIAPPFTDQKGAPHLNTFLVYVPTITVPAGFTRDNLPAGLCFIGRPYDDGNLIKYAYAYEQATHHRRPPASTTGL